MAGRRSKAGLHRWAAEVAAQGTFSAPFSADDAGASLGGLPVPHLVIGTKADMTGQLPGCRFRVSRLFASITVMVTYAVSSCCGKEDRSWASVLTASLVPDMAAERAGVWL